VRSYSQLSAQNRALLAQLDQAQLSDRTADLTQAADACRATTMWSSAVAECQQRESACSDDCDAVGDVTADTAVQSTASSVSSWSIPSAPPSPCASQSDSDSPGACQQHSLSADAEETAEHGVVAMTTHTEAATAVAAPTVAVQRYQQHHCTSGQRQLHSPKRCISPMTSVSLSWACAWTTTTVEPAHTTDVLTQPRRSQP
jgi:hypothetical protein